MIIVVQGKTKIEKLPPWIICLFRKLFPKRSSSEPLFEYLLPKCPPSLLRGGP